MSDTFDPSSHDRVLGDKYEHESFCTVQFSRMQTSPPTMLFNSDVPHSTVISLTIRRASYYRCGDLSMDHTFGNEDLVEVMLSPAQYAELLTTMNVGTGVSGTLRRYGKETYDLPKMKSRASHFKSEISSRLEDVKTELNEARAAAEAIFADNAPIRKADKERFASALQRVESLFKSYMPFIIDQFGKTLEKMTTEAKADVESFVEHAAMTTGIEALKKSQGMLE